MNNRLAALLALALLGPGPLAACSKAAPPVEPVATTAPADPAAVPADPAVAPADPAVAPADPAVVPADPAAVPADPAVAPADPAAMGAVPADFGTYVSEEGGFSVMAPGTPKIDSTTAESVLGPVVYKNVMFPLADGALMIAWGDMPVEGTDEATRKSMFDGGRDGMVKSVKGTLVSEKEITLDGRPGREWLIEVPGPPEIGKIINLVRTYLDGKRNYILQGMRLESAPATKAEFFINSFKFAKPAADGGAAAPAPAEGGVVAPAPAPVEKTKGE